MSGHIEARKPFLSCPHYSLCATFPQLCASTRDCLTCRHYNRVGQGASLGLGECLAGACNRAVAARDGPMPCAVVMLPDADCELLGGPVRHDDAPVLHRPHE